MTEAICVRCGVTDATVRARSWHELDVSLCAVCHGAVTGEPLDSSRFTAAGVLLLVGLLVVAAGAAAYLLTR